MAQFVSIYRIVTDPQKKIYETPYTIIPDSETVSINGLEQCKGATQAYVTWEGNKIIFNSDVELKLTDLIQIKFQRD